jgi:hypothetical protein
MYMAGIVRDTLSLDGGEIFSCSEVREDPRGIDACHRLQRGG